MSSARPVPGDAIGPRRKDPPPPLPEAAETAKSQPKSRRTLAKLLAGKPLSLTSWTVDPHYIARELG